MKASDPRRLRPALRQLGALMLVLASSAAQAQPQTQTQTAADGQAASARGDYAQAERIWRPLAERGDAAAQTGMGNLHAAGRGRPQDYATAAGWFSKAAEQGSAVAQHALAGLYQRGRGVPQDEAVAVLWYRRAAEQGYAPAQSSLGYLVENGRGAPKDEVQAAQWYRKAAAQGDAAALTNLAALADEGRGVKRDPALAAALLARAAALAPARADITALAQAAQGRLQPAQQGEADALQASMANPGGMASALARLDTAATPAATGATAPRADAGAATAKAAGETVLQGRCLQFEGEWAKGASPCAGRAVVSLAGATPEIRVVDGPNLRALAVLKFDKAQRTAGGDGAAQFSVASANDQAVIGTCGYQYPALQPMPGLERPAVTLSCILMAQDQPRRALLSWTVALDKPAPGERERWASALEGLRDRVNPKISDAALAAVQADAQRRIAAAPPPPPAPPPAPSRPSEDPKAIFGLQVGGRFPSMRACVEGESMPKDQPWCFERDNSGNSSLAHLLTERAEFYRKAGASPFQVKINDQMFDTSMLFAIPLLGNLPWIELWVGRDQTVLMLRVSTRLGAVDALSQLLTQKYGKPTRRDDTEWRNNQTGQIVRRTPNLRWNLADLAIDYESQKAGMLFNEPSTSGTLMIHSADFARRVNEIERQSAPPPKRSM